ncbi:MAG TPA: PLP-dependent aminotransferase family protein [Nocardioides sp.]|uniref:MocR-like transcription factor YczR n=1 Tax=Nocardioides sp. TaxID=35761 RepID=UPI002C4E346E|nr:PLP-dependent aminotransferase family protein [Nocardioides sp.]HQR27091.1 PLP-dependent aminotransferase family protein [Nocardioides sp.]
MTRTVGPARVAALVDGFDPHPAYSGLADAVQLAIGDGRIPPDTRLPSERDLAVVLGLSRTTVTRAYAELRERGYAAAQRGSGTFTRIPGGRARTLDRALSPRDRGDGTTIDLSCAASSAVPGLTAAYAAAVADLPAYLSGPGYYPAGLPELQRAVAATYEERGLPTDPDQVMITPGALAAATVVARTLLRTGDRVLVEAPVYPNAPRSFAAAGGRLVTTPVDPDGWDVETLTRTTRRLRPAAAYLIPDYQNPTGRLMGDRDRSVVARALAAAGTVTVVDETLHLLGTGKAPAPRPLAAHLAEAGGTAICVGGVSKVVWGGLRIGWLRAPASMITALTETRLAMDLGAPVLEQLATARLLAGIGPVLAWHRERLARQRETLLGALARELPDWSFRPPDGGLAVWCRLPAPRATALADEAERLGVVVTPGPVFAPEGGFGSWLRIPCTRPEAELVEAVARLREAWRAATAPRPERRRPRRTVVA